MKILLGIDLLQSFKKLIIGFEGGLCAFCIGDQPPRLPLKVVSEKESKSKTQRGQERVGPGDATRNSSKENNMERKMRKNKKIKIK